MKRIRFKKLRQRVAAYRLRRELHKRITSEVHGRGDDSKKRQQYTRNESHRDVQAAYRDRDFDLLLAYDKYLSATYGTVHARYAAGALRILNTGAFLTFDLTPDLVSTAGRVCTVLRETDPDFAISRKQDTMILLTAAVIQHPEYEYPLLDLVTQHGVPQAGSIDELLDLIDGSRSLAPGVL